MGFSYKNKKGTKYYLHHKKTLYYFSKSATGSVNLPSKFKVIVSKKTGLPFVKSKK